RCSTTPTDRCSRRAIAPRRSCARGGTPSRSGAPWPDTRVADRPDNSYARCMTASDEIALVWFRRDLRLDDNPAWAAATSACKYIVRLYVIEPQLLESVGPFRRRQLVANLQALDYELAEGDGNGGRLLVRFGDPRRLVPEAIDVLGAGHLYFNAD